MSWPDDIAESFPAPRDDEPQSLRQDIADEVGDHLQCAFRRETVTTPDEQLARKKVLDRFGNPHQIARQLWFDALQEKIMSQRIMLGLTVALALICLSATGMTWLVVNESRAATAALMERSQAANALLMQQIAKLSTPSTAPPPSLEWNDVKVRLVTPNRQTKVAEGVKLSLVGHVLDTGKEAAVPGTMDANGLVTFGLVRPGQHMLRVLMPWNEEYTRRLMVRPGEADVEEIVCPPAVPSQSNLGIVVDWPDDLRTKNLWFIGDFGGAPRSYEGRTWRWMKNPESTMNSRQSFSTMERQILVSPEGKISIHTVENDANERRFAPQLDFSQRFGGTPPGVPSVDRRPMGLVYFPNSTSSPSGGIPFPAKYRSEPLQLVDRGQIPSLNYVLRNIVIGIPDDETTSLQQQFNVLGAILVRFESRNGFTNRTQPFAVFEPEAQPHFEAVAGQTNEWKITLPDELLKIVREQLAKVE